MAELTPLTMKLVLEGADAVASLANVGQILARYAAVHADQDLTKALEDIQYAITHLSVKAVTADDVIPPQFAVPPMPEFAVPRSPHWGRVRAAHLKDHPCCACCGGAVMLQVHHVRPFHVHPELELDPANLITLCEVPNRHCHYTQGHNWDWKDWNPDVVTECAKKLHRVRHRMYERNPPELGG
jgi:5-methylcytosine-specific restriction enzyme A